MPPVSHRVITLEFYYVGGWAGGATTPRGRIGIRLLHREQAAGHFTHMIATVQRGSKDPPVGPHIITHMVSTNNRYQFYQLSGLCHPSVLGTRSSSTTQGLGRWCHYTHIARSIRVPLTKKRSCKLLHTHRGGGPVAKEGARKRLRPQGWPPASHSR